MTTEDRKILDDFLSQFRSAMIAETTAMVKKELRVFQPMVLGDDARETEVPGVGPILMQEMKDMEIELKSLRLKVVNISLDRDILRKELKEAADYGAKVTRELEIYKAGAGLEDVKANLVKALEQLSVTINATS